MVVDAYDAIGTSPSGVGEDRFERLHGSDDLAVGWRARGERSRGLAVYFVDREGALKAKQMIDTGIDCEDLIVGDFNGDKRPDIVASGRATHNVKIYWNEAKKGTGH